MNDTIVAEVRKVRDELARRFKYDLHAICANLRREQDLSGAQVVSFVKKSSAVPDAHATVPDLQGKPMPIAGEGQVRGEMLA